MTLAEFIERGGLSQASFAEMAGLPRPMISQWLNARRRPSLTNAIVIERVTGGAVPVACWALTRKRKRGR